MKRLSLVSTALAGCALAGGALGLGSAAASPSGNAGSNAMLATNLTGGAVVPGPADPDGSGSARITFVAGEQNVCFELSVRNIQTATMAHIHPGTVAEVGGPPLVALTTPTTGEASGCVSAPQAVVDAIRANPSNFFVTVHNAEFPGGAVRGQFGG
jgi:hypothetical protein